MLHKIYNKHETTFLAIFVFKSAILDSSFCTLCKRACNSYDIVLDFRQLHAKNIGPSLENEFAFEMQLKQYKQENNCNTEKSHNGEMLRFPVDISK